LKDAPRHQFDDPRYKTAKQFWQVQADQSSPAPPFQSFVFTLAATGTTGRKCGNWKAES